MLIEFLFIYPFVLSFLWTVFGGIYLLQSFLSRRPERDGPEYSYSVIVPFHNEPQGALRTAWSLSHVSPPPQDIILVDDGSAEGLPEDTGMPPRTSVLRLSERGGKARALNMALKQVKSELVVCLGADTTVVSQDWRALLTNFEDPSVGAVTGKIWPSNPKGLVQRLQHLDYVSVICLIKAAESTWGTLLTVSGAFVAFRRSALESVGGWNEATATEDIDLSWRLQLSGWRIGFENRWIGRVEMVPTIPGLWRQRRRWSTGLGRTMRDHLLKAYGMGSRQLPVAKISVFNTLWIASTLAVFGWLLANNLLGSGETINALSVSAEDRLTYAVISLLVFGGQFSCAALIDGRPWRTYLVLLLLAPLYPLYFWCVMFTSFLAGFPVGLMRRDSGIWKRTDRLNAKLNIGTSL